MSERKEKKEVEVTILTCDRCKKKMEKNIGTYFTCNIPQLSKCYMCGRNVCQKCRFRTTSSNLTSFWKDDPDYIYGIPNTDVMLYICEDCIVTGKEYINQINQLNNDTMLKQEEILNEWRKKCLNG